MNGLNKYIYYTIVTILSALQLFSCSNNRSYKNLVENNNGSLTIEPSRISLGRISGNSDKQEHFCFTITNNTDSLIHISTIEPSCSCLKIYDYIDSVSAQSSIIVNGSIDLRNQFGHISKTIFISYEKGEVCLFRIIGDITE